MRARAVVATLLVALALAGCSDDDDDGRTASADRSSTTTSSTTTSSTSSTSTTAPTTSTTAFAGSTSATTVPLDTDHTTLLTAVEVTGEAGFDRVVFRFRGAGVPLVDIGYVTDPRADGSGAPVTVEGGATLQVRMEPAATFDMSSEDAARTYTGPDRVRGETAAVTEVVRSGDFEANLTWVIGLRQQAPFRVSSDASAGTVTVEVAAG